MVLQSALETVLPLTIHMYWIAVTAAATIASFPVNGLQMFRDMVRLSASRGKLWEGRPRPSLGFFTDASVPQAFFAHFYAVGVATNAVCIWIFFTSLQEQKDVSTQQAASALALGMLQVHLLRRLIESLFIMVYPPKARMHVIAYAFGISYYILLSISMLPRNDLRLLVQWPKDAARVTVLRSMELAHLIATTSGSITTLGVFVFCCGNILQNHTHRILARLAKNSGQPHHLNYSIPTGGGFTFVSSPHYFGEIIIYCGLVLIMNGSHLDAWLILAWVVSNLVVAARETQAWYRRHFKSYPTSRKALLPFIW